jgi:membrane-associated protein
MVPAVPSLVSRYGLAVVGLGTLIEGETILLIAGALAGRGDLNPIAVWAVAASGAWLGHVIWFSVGRRLGRQRILASRPQWRPALVEADGLIGRRPWTCIFALQYLYGMRLPGAVALGLTSLPMRWFMAAEAVNCLTWAALVETVGYVAGDSAGAVLQGSGWIIWVLLSALVVAVVVHRILRGRRTTTPDRPT